MLVPIETDETLIQCRLMFKDSDLDRHFIHFPTPVRTKTQDRGGTLLQYAARKGLYAMQKDGSLEHCPECLKR